jgi:membrane protease YdiL (CAAX protease family)
MAEPFDPPERQPGPEQHSDKGSTNPISEQAIEPASSTKTAGAAPSPLRNIFVGSNGLRAGWRLLVFLVLFGICAAILERLSLFLAGPGRFTLVSIAFMELVLFGSALSASGIMGRIEKRTFADYGLPAQGAFGSRFWEGSLWGFVALSFLLLLLRITRSFEYGVPAIKGLELGKYALLWGCVFLLVALAEEYTFRGYPLFTLSSGIGFWPAALILSALFGLVHLGNPGESWLGGFNAGFIGVFFCLTLRRSGSLWFAIGTHMGWDWGETFFYGVPDSGQVAPGHFLSPVFHGSKWLTGGTVGPEGSVLAMVVVAMMFMAFHYRFPPATRPRQFESGEPVPVADTAV